MKLAIGEADSKYYSATDYNRGNIIALDNCN